MHGSIFKGDRLQLDFASAECQQEFYEHLNKANSELNSIPLVPNNSNHKTNQKPKPLPPTDSNCKKPTNNSINIPCDSVIFTSNFTNIADLKKHFSVDFKNSYNTSNMTHNSNQKKPFENIQHALLNGKHPLECTSSIHNNERHVLEYARHNYDPLLSPPHSSPESSQSSNSDNSQVDTYGLHLDDKLTNFNKKFEQWEKTRTNYSNVYDSTKYNYSNIIDDIEPSDIVKYILSKPSVFNEDSKRLEHLSIKYIIKKCISYQKPKCSSISLPPISETRCIPSSHSLPTQSTQHREASSTDSIILSTNPKWNASDLSLPVHLRGPFLTRNNNCVINSSLLSKNVSNQYNGLDIRAEYTKNWIIGSFSGFKKEKKEEEDNIEIKKLDKKKLSEKFVIKKKNSNKTDLNVTPNVTEIQETQSKISDSIEIKSEYNAKLTNKIENSNVIKTIEENKPIKSHLILTDIDKNNSVPDENIIANSLSFDKYSLKMIEPKDFKDSVECISSNKSVNKLSNFEKINKFAKNSKETKNTKSELNMPKNNPVYNKNKEQPLINIHTQNTENNDEGEYLVNQPTIEDNADKIKIKQHTDEDVFKHKQIKQNLDKSDEHKKSEKLEEYVVCNKNKIIPTIKNSKLIINDDVKCTKKQIDTNCISSNSYSDQSISRKTNYGCSKSIEINKLSKTNSTHIKQNHDSFSSEILNIINNEQKKSREKTKKESNMLKILSQTTIDDNNDNKEIIEKDEISLPTTDFICTTLYDEVKSKSLNTNQLTSKK